MTTPEPFERWALTNAIPRDYWHLCRAAWEAGAQHATLPVSAVSTTTLRDNAAIYVPAGSPR